MVALLAIETSTEACSVALSIDGKVIENFGIMPRMHSQKILPMIDQLLVEANIRKSAIDAIAFGCGPGAFTGVRISTAVTQGLAFSLDVPVISVSSLAALAQLAIRKQSANHIVAAIDARMGEIYWGLFDCDKTTGLAISMTEEKVCVPEEVLPDAFQDKSWVGVGSGWNYADNIPARPSIIDANALPHAQDIATLALPHLLNKNTINPKLAIPTYLRNNVARKKPRT